MQDGVIAVAFRIDRHFDVINAYNSTTGEVGAWTTNGTGVSGWLNIGYASSGWTIYGVGGFRS